MPGNINALIARGVGADNPQFNYLDSRTRAANSLLAEQKMQAYPEDRAFMRQQQGLSTEKQGWEREDRMREMEMRPLKDEKEAIELLGEIGQTMTLENYPAYREHLIKVNKINPALFPDPSTFQGNPQAFESWKQQGAMTLSQYSKSIEAKAKMVAAGKEKSQTEEQLTRSALYSTDPEVRQQAQMILDAMQKRKIQTAQSMPAPTVYVGDTSGGKPIVTGGTKGRVGLLTPDVPGGGPIMSKNSQELTTGEKKARDAVKASRSIVGELKAMWDKIAPATRFEGTKAWAEAKAGRNVEAKSYMDQRLAFLGVLARSLGGEVGVLTDRDIERIDRALARIGANPLENDTADEADAKWETIERIMDAAEQRYIDSLSVTSRQDAMKQNVGRGTIGEDEPYEVGKLYEDAKGRRMKYLGKAKWGKPDV